MPRKLMNPRRSDCFLAKEHPTPPPSGDRHSYPSFPSENLALAVHITPSPNHPGPYISDGKVYLPPVIMVEPVDKSRLCDCGDIPVHTVGWCDALVKASRR